MLGLLFVCLTGLGALIRVPNSTLTNLPANLPTQNYTYTNAFPGLVFTNPVCLASPPGETNRLFILEKLGRIVVITNLAAPTRSLFLDLTSRVQASDSVGDERGLLGLAFHPGFATNRYFYVFYTGATNTTAGTGLHDILARFEASPVDPNQALPATHLPLLLQYDQANNHNGGDLHFGPDGYLYVSLGDEGGGNDEWNNSQRITKDFFAGLLRLDVDKRPGSLVPNPHSAVTTNYAVPPDNPWVGATQFNGVAVSPAQVHTEFWAVGLRNPWRFCFDDASGRLYLGDVGQGAREEINLIEGGGNYGWNYCEGTIQWTNSAALPVGFTNWPPLWEYPRTAGFAVVGGRVYRGNRLPDLSGDYVYGDYDSGRIWALRHSGTNVTQNQHLFTDPSGGITAFGLDPSNGDVLYCDAQGGFDSVLKRIVTASASGPPLPSTLGQTGAFTNLITLAPSAGVVPYAIGLPFWSDNAIKSRWFSVPNTNLAITFGREANWLFPTGTVWIKHFDFEFTNGVPASRRRLETRFLVKNAGGGYGITYRWDATQTNAALIGEGGLDEALLVSDGGNIRTQLWRYPGRAECLQCHTTAGGFAIGFNTPQLNHAFDYGEGLTNQIAAFSQAGYFNTNVTGIHTLRTLVHPTNELASLEARARSYLFANCSPCHQPAGPAQALWDGRLFTRTADAGLVNGQLINSGGDTNNRVLVPGSLAHSMILSRVNTRGAGQMPPLASSLVDTQGVALLSAWITNTLPGFQTFAQWQLSWFGNSNAPAASGTADPDGDEAINRLEFVTGTNPTNAADAWRISLDRSNGVPQVHFPQIANRGFEVQFATSLPSANWTALDVPENAPFFARSNRPASVPVTGFGTSPRYFRVRVFEP